MRIKSKQIKKYFAAPVRVSGLVVLLSATSSTITTQITTALSSAGYGTTSVPVVYSTLETEPGVIKTAYNRCELYNTATGNKIEYLGNEVYGRLTESSGVITLTYYYMLDGTETSYSFQTAMTIDFEFNYRFEFKDLPTDAIIAIKQRNVQDDVANTGGKLKVEKLTVSSLNSISALSITPVSGKNIRLLVNGYPLDSISTSPAFTVVGTAITWNASNADWDVETTDEVIAEYLTP